MVSKNVIRLMIGPMLLMVGCQSKESSTPTTNLTDFVNPLLGTATLWDKEDLGYERHRESRTWGGEVFPGATLPNAMVQLTPVTMWRSGGGYQYEDTTILGFAHTAMGHWNLIDIPMLPVTGEVSADDYASVYSHDKEEARPGYYRVYLDRYGVDAELTSTLRSGYHKYSFKEGEPKRLLVNVAHNQNPVREWELNQVGENSFAGKQGGIYYYAVTNLPIDSIGYVQSQIEMPELKEGERRERIKWPNPPVAVIDFRDNAGSEPLEVKVGLSYVSVDNAKLNLESEIGDKDFETIRKGANDTWEDVLSKIQVEGGSDKDKNLFYSTLYRSMIIPRLESDVNGDYRDANGNVLHNNGFRYYSNPPFWDAHRNQLILIGMLAPDVTLDILKSTIDRGEKSGGYIPSYFHGDHAPTFVIGNYKRGINDFNLDRAYALSLKSAMVPGRNGRRYLDEYIANGYITDENLPDCPYWDEHKGGVTKTLEYAYDDYAVAQIAKELGDSVNYKNLMERSNNYKNVFDPSTGFNRGRVEGGGWMTPYDPYYPYFQHMYREANGWNSIFYAPHDPEGMIALYPSNEAVEAKLDSLFTEPWRGYEVENLTGFIGQYTQGNQPGHNIPYTYYFIGKQEKSQDIIDKILSNYYDMGKDHLAYPGMDDGGEMSAWYVLNALGLYTYSPADPEYIVTVPRFDKVTFNLNGKPFFIEKEGNSKKITKITVNGEELDGYFVPHDKLTNGQTLKIYTE